MCQIYKVFVIFIQYFKIVFVCFGVNRSVNMWNHMQTRCENPSFFYQTATLYNDKKHKQWKICDLPEQNQALIDKKTNKNSCRQEFVQKVLFVKIHRNQKKKKLYFSYWCLLFLVSCDSWELYIEFSQSYRFLNICRWPCIIFILLWKTVAWDEVLGPKHGPKLIKKQINV